MPHPESLRFVPIREAMCAALVNAPALAEVKAMARDREGFARMPASQYPALGVFFADPAGVERPRWAANARAHSYHFEIHVAVRSLESGQASEDLLFAYIEAVEDVLRATPTLGGLVTFMSVTLVRRARAKVESYWHAQAVLLVSCEQKVV